MKMILWCYLILSIILTGSIYLEAQIGSTNDKLNLPQILKSNNGNEITKISEWEEIRRPEIIQLFEKYVYGQIPTNDIKISFKLSQEIRDGLCNDAIQKEVIVSFIVGSDTINMNILIFIPKNADKPVPLFLGLNFYGNHTIHPDKNISITPNYVNNKPEFCISNNKASSNSRGVRSNRWPVERIIERGYGLATIYYGDLDPDYHDGFQNGIHKLLYSKNNEMKPYDGGAIAAWSYGLSRAMDYFEKDENIDHNKIAVIGHSRLGKTSLWAGALDQRFAITISNNSGCGGAALSRRKSGETLNDINSRFPHWFCQNFHTFNNREDELPVDQHMLISLIAPRAVYIGSAVNDKWADPLGEYLSLYHAGPAYKLYYEDHLDIETLPELNSPRIVGKVGYHIRSGSHDLTKYDWEKYMDFADHIFLN